MSSAPNRRGLIFRRVLRGLRAGALFLAFVLTAALCYLSEFGFPDFVVRQLETEIRSHGLNFHLKRARLQGFDRVVAEGIRIGSGDTNAALLADVKEVELGLKTEALKRLQFKVDSLAIRGARVPFSGGPEPLALRDVTLAVLFPGEERLDLQYLNGRLGQTRVRLAGSFTHPLEARKWFAARHGKTRESVGTNILDQVARTLNRIQAPELADLDATFTGDGRDQGSFKAKLNYRLPAVMTQWGNARRAEASARISQSAANSNWVDIKWTLAASSVETKAVRLENPRAAGTVTYSLEQGALAKAVVSLDADAVKSEVAEARSAHLEASTQPNEGPADLKTRYRLSLRSGSAKWGNMGSAQVEGELFHSLTNSKSLRASWQMEGKNLRSELGSLESVRLRGRGERRIEPPATNESWGLWHHLAPFDLDWELEASGLNSPKVVIDQASLAGSWRAPVVSISKFEAALYDASFRADAQLDVVTRELTANAAFDVDAHKLTELLTPAARRWLRQFSWDKAPKVESVARLTLPEWTNRKASWRQDVLPTVTVAGKFEGTSGAFRGVQALAARSHFALTNGVWHLPDLQADRPEGRVISEYVGSMFTQDYYWKIDSHIDPKAVAPLFEPQQRRFFELSEFTSPPSIQAEVWGRWEARELTGFRGQIALTNVAFRGENCSEASASFAYTNMILRFENVLLKRNDERGAAPEVIFDIAEGVVDVTNAVSTLDPGVFTTWIGPKTHAVMEPYKFAKGPAVRVSGRLPTGDIRKTDVRFAVAGTDFQYWRFRIPHVSGDVHWQGESLTISNVQASFYDGDMRWQGAFDFSPKEGTLFNFQTTVRNVDFKKMMADVSLSTNRLEGSLDGTLIITSANSDDWKSWNGYGNARLQDGFIWSIPIFGFFSPILNSIAPGLGSTRATAATASFQIEHSVVYTRDLEARAPAVRLQYDGSVDFNGVVNSRVQAEILRDAWAVGRLVSIVLWPISKIFEYKVTGTLQEPKTELLHIPAFVSWPFYPFRMLRNAIIPDGKEKK